jgi:hypothetical protein
MSHAPPITTPTKNRYCIQDLPLFAKLPRIAKRIKPSRRQTAIPRMSQNNAF